MQKGTAEKLLTALNSGKYTIGHGQLRYDNCYCVLGVLLDIIDPTKWKLDWTQCGYTWEGETFFLPERIMKSSKIKTRELWFETENGEKMSLVKLNDYSDQVITKHYLKKYYQQM